MNVMFVFVKPLYFLIPLEAALFLVFVWMLSFFRDPVRDIINDEGVLYSPADGTITDISVTDMPVSDVSAPGTKVLKIGMFLSIFSVHINRFPCSVRVEKVTYNKGRFKNAMSAESGRVNESNDVLMLRLVKPEIKFLVRQISGAVARRIVCEAGEKSEYAQGQPFGMIKFGSRAELYIPANGSGEGLAYEVAVKTGDKVYAGLTPLIRFQK